jgi:hypothetical protein
MIKRLIFVTGFGVGFVVGSASGRKSYEALKQNAVKTWHDPKVQEKVSEGTDWVKSEVPVVGGKLADSAKKAADTVGTRPPTPPRPSRRRSPGPRPARNPPAVPPPRGLRPPGPRPPVTPTCRTRSR